MKNNNNRGFTLGELLIVVSIIAVLVAVSVPIFAGQLEKSREATDLANVRAAYAEIMSAAITEDKTAVYSVGGQPLAQADGSYSAVVPLKQKQDNWQGHSAVTVGGVSSTDTAHWLGTPRKEGSCRVVYTEKSGILFQWNGLSSLPGSCWDSTGGYLTYKSGGYESYKANAVTELLDAKGGQKLVYSSLSDNPIIKAELDKGYTYKIGLYYLDVNDTNANGSYKILYNSGEKDWPIGGNFYTIQDDEITSGQEVKVAIQYFKYAPDGTKPIDLSGSAEANALAGLFYLQ